MTDWNDPDAEEREFIVTLAHDMTSGAVYGVFALAVSVILLLAYL